MFKTDSFLGNKKSSLNQNVWRDHATMQQDVLLHFWVIFLHLNQAKMWKNILLFSSRAFSLYAPVKQWGYMKKSYKMQQKYRLQFMYSPRCSENHFATHHEFTCWAKIRQSYIMTNQSFFSRTSQTSNR